MLLGGISEYSHTFENFDSSIAYHSDDITWCVQRAKFLPLAISFFRIATPSVWLLVVGLAYVNGFIIYFFVQFDTKPKHHKFDLHYALVLISLPSWIGVSQTFNPKYWPLRLYYFTTVLFGMLVFASFSFELITRGQIRLRFRQTNSIDNIVDMKFRLAGSSDVVKHLQQQSPVSLDNVFVFMQQNFC